MRISNFPTHVVAKVKSDYERNSTFVVGDELYPTNEKGKFTSDRMLGNFGNDYGVTIEYFAEIEEYVLAKSPLIQALR